MRTETKGCPVLKNINSGNTYIYGLQGGSRNFLAKQCVEINLYKFCDLFILKKKRK